MQSSSTARLALLIVSLLLVVSCSKSLAHRDSEPEKATGPAAAVQTTTHQGVGVVKKLDPKIPAIEIDHEDIKDLMPAMQMEFVVKDKSLLNGLAVNDKISFTIENGIHGMLITAIKKI